MQAVLPQKQKENVSSVLFSLQSSAVNDSVATDDVTECVLHSALPVSVSRDITLSEHTPARTRPSVSF